MPCFVGLDASKLTTNICVLDDRGDIVLEGVVASDPKAIVEFLRGDGRRYKRVGLESWNLAPWLYAGLARAGLPVICIETRQSSAVLKASRSNKTDRNDARGIAEIMRAGIYKVVHVKSLESQRVLGLLTARKLLRTKATDMENALRALLLSFGLKLGTGSWTTFETRVLKLADSDKFLVGLVRPLLSVRDRLLAEMRGLEDQICNHAKEDPTCRRLMTAPGVGPITSLLFRASIDEPARFVRSRDVGAHFGLTPRSNQSGERDFRGRISKCGDNMVRNALFIAARSQLKEHARPSQLRAWGLEVAARRGRMKASVAMARRLAVILHRMWVSQTDFRWAAPERA